MDIICDGLIYQREKRGGISGTFNELLPGLVRANKDIRIKILKQGRMKSIPPLVENIQHINIFPIEKLLRNYPEFSIIWETYWKIFFLKEKNKIWLSTYYSVPKFWNGPKIVFVYDIIHEKFPAIFNTKNNKMFLKRKKEAIEAGDILVFNSENTVKDIKKIYNFEGKKIVVLYPGCRKVYKERNFKKTERNRPFFLYVGVRKSKYKNFDLVVDALKSCDKFELIVAGAPFSEQEKKSFEKKEILDRIQGVEYPEDDRLCDLYNQAEALIYPSAYEGFGMPLVEAMACNCPIIASDIPSTREVAKEYPVYFDSKEPNSLIKAMKSDLSKNNENRKSIREKAIKKYTWSSGVNVMNEVVEFTSSVKG